MFGFAARGRVLLRVLLLAGVAILVLRRLLRRQLEDFGEFPVMFLQQLQRPQRLDARGASRSVGKLARSQGMFVDGNRGVGRLASSDSGSKRMVVRFN